MVSKLFYMMVFGAVGGVLAWFVNEPFMNDDIRRTVDWGELARFGSTLRGLAAPAGHAPEPPADAAAGASGRAVAATSGSACTT